VEDAGSGIVTGRVKVLIVDADPEAREQAAVILGGFGFTVLQSSDGADALRQARGAAELTLLVVASRLADTAGIRLADMVRRIHPEASVLMSVGFGGEADADGYPVLRKPYRFGPFIRAVREQLIPA
jgi:DNA-binding response OmpR family regulator